jgi:L-threonylcarbamoyladenylate synthase
MIVYDSLADPALARRLLNGAVGVLPTDTIYGIVARAEDPKAVARLYALKQREGKPVHLWPNPISLVLPAPASLHYLDQGKQSLAVRVPQHEALARLLQQTGPLLTSSANWPGEAAATTMEEAQDYFGDEVAFYVDGGNTRQQLASTVGRLLPNGTIEVLRQGSAHIS